MSEERLPIELRVRRGAALCANCGQPWALHHTANFSDGPFIGRRLEICPTAVFVSRPGEPHPLEPPLNPPQPVARDVRSVGSAGGRARAKALDPVRRSQIARDAANTRWRNRP